MRTVGAGRWCIRGAGVLMVVASMMAGCSREPVVATVDGHRITAAELVAEASARGIPLEPAALQQLLEVIIDRNAAAVKAEETDLLDDPDFQRAYQNLALETLKSRYRLDWEQELAVSDADIQAEYDRNPAAYTVPEKIRLALIVFEREAQTGELSTVQDAFERLQATPKGDARDRLFQMLAVNHSMDRASRYRGGDVGMLVKGESSQWPATVQSAAFALNAVGDVGKVVDAGGQDYLVKLESRHPERLEPLSAVRDGIRQRLLTARFDAIRQRTQSRLREDITIRTFSGVLATLGKPSAGNDSGSPLPPGPTLD